MSETDQAGSGEILRLPIVHLVGWRTFILVVLLNTCGDLSGQSLAIDQVDAIVWSSEQIVTGSLDQTSGAGTLFLDESSIPFDADADAFAIPIELTDGAHTIVACAEANGVQICSDTLTFELGYERHPEIFAEAAVSGDAVTLQGYLLDHPNGGPISFEWSADDRNPGSVALTTESDTVAAVTFRAADPPGEYYFDLLATDSTGAVGKARTFVTKSDSAIRPFDIWSDHAAWVDSAVIYEVTPYIFVANGRLADVTARLPELKEFGINTVWIQPVFGTAFGGQGYDITNYFQVREDLGTEEDLRTLVKSAHDMGMRVLLDFVPNHTSIHHPYAQDAIDHGSRSHYYNFYQRELDNVPYSQHYHQRSDHEMVFTYYFWEDLVNLDYHNPEVRRWMIEAGLRWIEDFDIDGYRIDAVWGTNARTPEAMQQWRFALKRAKPEILLLGEDKATHAQTFDRRFDVAYDWYPEESWVSHWTWQYSYSETENLTLFNVGNQRVRSRMLRDAITNRGNGFHPDAKVLRFMENNDIFRFYATHSPNAPDRTRLAATILFTLHGIPLIYNGQEISYPRHPYRTYQIFYRNEPIADQDDVGLYPYYRQLIRLRKSWPAFWSDNYEEVAVDPRNLHDFVFAYRRWDPGKRNNVFVAANLGDSEVTAAITVPDAVRLDPDETYFITDLMTGEYWSSTGSALVRIVTKLPAYTARVLALGESPAPVVTSNDEFTVDLPLESTVEQNYPNPFSGSTIIPLHLATGEHVRVTVHDVVGREVRELLDGTLQAGRREVTFDATGIPSGTYFVRVRIGYRHFTRAVSVIR